jgi:xanthine dehydrogenase YagR molybdenum-binding subunit
MSKTPADYYRDDPDVPATPPPGKRPEPWEETDVVGTARSRVDGYARVSGAAIYASDVVLPHMLYAAVRRCPHPSAKVAGIDLEPARRMPGVRAVIGPHDPEGRIAWSYGKGHDTPILTTDCLYEGETVAAVAADSAYQAADAAAAIDVEFETRAFVSDERAALDEGAARVHPGGNRAGVERYARGDVEQGFAQADVVLERSFRTECVLHTPMELHGCVARWDGDRLTLWESTQGVYSVQKGVARMLELPLSKVRVIGHYMGGGFGSKLRTDKHAVLAALLARKTGRPVKLFVDREDTFTATGNRPPADMTLKAGVTALGRLTALEMTCTGTGGAYPAGGVALVDWLVRDLYTCENVRTECTDVFINAGPARPFRAPGHPQGAWALEQMMDELAHEIGMDPVELRRANVPEHSQARGGRPYTTTGLDRCLEEGAEAFGWRQARKGSGALPDRPHVRRGAGMAACLWIAGDGGPPSTVIVKLFADGSVNLNMGASDIGTGTKTVMALVVSEELGVDPDAIQIEHADTATTQYATPSGGSKTVPTEAPTVRNASVAVKRELLEMAGRQLGVEPERLDLGAGWVVEATGGARRMRITDVEGLAARGVLVGVGTRGPNPEDKVVNPFGAQFCEVEVDTLTGEIAVTRFLGAHESGRVMSRLTYDNQVYGGITMGLGLATTEKRILDRNTGKLVSRSWHDYKLPTVMDVPVRMTSLPIEMEDPEANVTGAKGLGEPVTIPTAAAVANAVRDALGVRPATTPINPTTLVSLVNGEEG